MTFFSDENKLASARRIFEHIGKTVNACFSIRLWDGSKIHLGKDVDSDYFISINGPGVIGALLRKPTYENLFLQYVNGHVDIHGDLINFAAAARKKRSKNKRKK